jgi:hydroxymethylbilane synthase
MKKITIASRESKLALWQTHFVKDVIKEKLDLDCEIVTMKTQGDIILDKPLSQIGGKALFMKELERSMQRGGTNIAVHSLKDVPFELPQGFCLASFMPRADPRDAFVSNNFSSIDDLPKGAIVGTSSLRRKSQLLNYRNDLIIKDLRGNVQTRLSKLDSGNYDAIILAGAGLIRLGLEARVAQYIPIEISLPAVGQGIVVIEVLENELELINFLKKINDETSSIVATAERAFNQELQGGCHVAIAAYATVKTNGTIDLQAMVASSDGKEILKLSNSGLNPMEVGSELAKKMISQGAYDILER